MAQFFVGLKSMVCDVIAIRTDKQFVNSLEDNIRYRGAPTTLVSDSVKSETSKRVKDILRSLCINEWQSEPYQHHQNPAERCYQTVKRLANHLLDRCRCPPNVWLLALNYACMVLNHTACKSIGYKIPLSQLLGRTVDTSVFLRFQFFEPVYYLKHEYSFPEESREGRGHFVGIAEHVGHAMTYRILTGNTRQILNRSNVCTALNPDEKNL